MSLLEYILNMWVRGTLLSVILVVGASGAGLPTNGGKISPPLRGQQRTMLDPHTTVQ